MEIKLSFTKVYLACGYTDLRKSIDGLSYLVVNVNIRMYNFDDVQCTVIPSVAYGFVTGMNLQLC